MLKKYNFSLSEEFAKNLDEEDDLKLFKDRFYINKDIIYMDGNSLGLLSKDSEASLLRVINEFKEQGINGWMDAKEPWFTYAEKLGAKQAVLVGACEDEVIVTASTTINMHNLLATFYKPDNKRKKILMDELNFPSDFYAVQSQIRLHNLDVDKNLVIVKSRDGNTINEEDIISMMDEDVAVAIFPSVLYRSGQLLDMQLLTKKAHEKGIIIGFDCCHSVGAVPHKLHDWDADFAFWCNYKYLNSGPGSTGSLFVNRKHFDRMPGLAGWWGYNKNKQFDMLSQFEPSGNAGGWQISTINLFSSAPLEGSLKIFEEAGIDAIRSKSLKQTSYLMYLIDNMLTKEPYNFKIGTPRDEDRRGGHVALQHDTEALRISKCLKEKGVIPDFRYPNVIRLAPIALYTSYYEVWKVVNILKDIMDNKDYLNFENERGTVS